MAMDYLNYRNAFLAHHGILGQKWGKRNGPPYPLDAEDHSAREKKAGWQKSLDRNEAKRQKKIAAINKHHKKDRDRRIAAVNRKYDNTRAYKNYQRKQSSLENAKQKAEYDLSETITERNKEIERNKRTNSYFDEIANGKNAWKDYIKSTFGNDFESEMKADVKSDAGWAESVVSMSSKEYQQYKKYVLDEDYEKASKFLAELERKNENQSERSIIEYYTERVDSGERYVNYLKNTPVTEMPKSELKKIDKLSKEYMRTLSK